MRSTQGVLTQLAVAEQLGDWGESLVACSWCCLQQLPLPTTVTLVRTVSPILQSDQQAIPAFRISVLMMIVGPVQDLGTVFSFSDLTMALLALTNLLALWYLAPIGRSAQRLRGATEIGRYSRLQTRLLPKRSRRAAGHRADNESGYGRLCCYTGPTAGIGRAHLHWRARRATDVFFAEISRRGRKSQVRLSQRVD